MYIKLFGFFYFFVIFFCILITIGLYFLLKNKSDKVKYNVILGLGIFAYLLHFLKILHPYYYENISFMRSSITFENICAVNTLLLPYFIIFKNNKMRDYFVLVGSMSGIFALIYPVDLIGSREYYFEVFRFYFAHYVLFLIPFLMLVFGFHKLNLKRIIYYPLTFLIIQIFILFNEIMLISFKVYNMDLNDLFSNTYRNASMIHGVFDNDLVLLKNLLTFMTPDIMLYNKYTNGETFIPIVWLIIPSFIYMPLQYIIFYKIFRKDEGYDRSRCKIEFSKR